MQTPSVPDPLMQREPGLQSPSYAQVLPVARFGGTLSSPISEDGPWVQTPSKHMVPDSQSVSTTKAKAEVEVRQTIVTAIRLRTVAPLRTPLKITSLNVGMWTGQERQKTRLLADSREK